MIKARNCRFHPGWLLENCIDFQSNAICFSHVEDLVFSLYIYMILVSTADILGLG